jgi:hypothetical protein
MKKPLPYSAWQHFKGGKYIVIGYATHSETKEKMIIYNGGHGSYVRPYKMWHEKVIDSNGNSVARFTEI